MSCFGFFKKYTVKKGSYLNVPSICSSAFNTFCYEHSKDMNAKRTSCNISLLVVLYIMQGIPLGIIAIIPNIIKESGGTFAQQAKFSLVGWPYALKILWAPIVDSLYLSHFGRRKTWLVFMQYSMAFVMMLMSLEIHNLLNFNINDAKITKLTVICFVLKLIVATQDIAVDGWALTMSKYSSCTYICDIFGIFFGFFIGYIALPSLESPNFCNTYIRIQPKEYGLITMSGFLWFLGISYIAVTTIIALFSEEETGADYVTFGISGSYKIVVEMLRSPAVQFFALLLLTERVSYVPYEALNEFKLMEKGFTRSQLSVLNVPIYLFQMCLPWFINNLIDVKRPLDSHFRVMPFRILLSAIGAITTYTVPFFMKDGRIGITNFVIYVLIGCIYKLCICIMSTSKAVFFANISDPSLGGTNLSLLHALNSIGGHWPNILSLWLVDKIEWKKCSSPENCRIILDGYYIELIFSIALGLLWLNAMKQCVFYLQLLPKQNWATHHSKR